MPYALTALVAAVAFARGGYSAWGILLLELGAAVLVLWVVAEVLWRTSDVERGLQRRTRRGTADVEIVLPGEDPAVVHQKPSDRYLSVLGFAFRKIHIAIPLLLLCIWVAVSLVPLDAELLSLVSPRAFDLRGAAGPSSLSPFVTARNLWMLLACVGLVFVGAHCASEPARASRLALLLFALGVAFGAYGIVQWLFGLQDLFGRDPSTASLRASGSFGNRNHYAGFMEMLTLSGLGWASARRQAILAAFPGRRGVLRRMEQTGGKLFLLGLGVVAPAVGLVFSLSRSGIAFGLSGAAAFVWLSSRRSGERSPSSGVRGIFAIALVAVSLAAWIGLDPVVHRFRLLENEWEAELGRTQVWRDSMAAVPDFAVTGSGFGTYRYVFPIYRSFGGTVAYSWAHNDYLQLLIELGVPGMSLALWAMGALVWFTWRARRRLAPDSTLWTIHAGCMAAVIAMALHSFTDFGLHLAANAALLSVIVGMCVAMEPGRPVAKRR